MLEFKVEKIKQPRVLENRYEIKILKNNRTQHTIYLDSDNVLTKKEAINKAIEILLNGYLDRFKETFVKLVNQVYVNGDDL